MLTIISFTSISAMCIDMSELEFGEVVGRGSFATVHRGSWKGHDVALKKMKSTFGAMPRCNLLYI